MRALSVIESQLRSLHVFAFLFSSALCFGQAGHLDVTDATVVTTNGTLSETVTNVYPSAALTAFELSYSCAVPKRLMLYDYDALTDGPGHRPLNIGESRSVQIPASFAPCKGGITAALFADGHTWGNSDSISKLQTHRLGFEQQLKEIDLGVADVVSGHQDLALLRERLVAQSNALPKENGLSIEEKTGRLRAIHKTLDLLSRRTLRQSTAAGMTKTPVNRLRADGSPTTSSQQNGQLLHNWIEQTVEKLVRSQHDLR